MVDVSKLKNDKIEHPAAFYATPDDIVKDNDLSTEEKKKALNSWEQDARRQLIASNEGMAGSKEGIDPSDHSRLGEIERAKDKIGTLAEADPFAHLRNSSPLYNARTTADGTLIIQVRVNGDEQSLTDFQPVALEALEIAAENSRHVTEHLVPGRRGGRLYDKIIIHP